MDSLSEKYRAEFWEGMRETKERMRETDRQIKELKEQMKETDRRMKETDRRMKETDKQMKETDRRMKETDRRMKETDKQMKETDKRMKETDKLMKETDKLMRETRSTLDGLGFSCGMVAESFFVEATKERGIIVDGIKFKQNSVNFAVMDGFEKKAEIDIVFRNGKYILFVETKYRLDGKQITTLDKKLAAVKKYAPDLLKGKEILTGFASLGVKSSIRDMFIAAGHYVLTQDDNSVRVEGNFIKKASEEQKDH